MSGYRKVNQILQAVLKKYVFDIGHDHKDCNCRLAVCPSESKDGNTYAWVL
jgi:hypothetical protein